MSDLGEPAENPWIRSSWSNFYTANILFVGPVLSIVFLSVIDVVAKLPSLVGVPATVGIFVTVLGGGLFVDVYLVEASKPRAIRIGPEGVDVRTLSGRVLRASMEDFTLAPSGRPGWGVMRVRSPKGRRYFLEPNQYNAMRAVAPLRP